MQRLRPLLVILSAVLLIAFAGCSRSGSSEGGEEPAKPAGAEGAAEVKGPKVEVALDEWSVEPKPASVKAGKVTFVANNSGTMVHELVVLQTDTKGANLPVMGARAEEPGEVLADIDDISPGQSAMMTVDLKPGHYVLLCNLPGHYKAGMYIDFTVE